jgi:ABC-type lipoprotein release transport system permease subunit
MLLYSARGFWTRRVDTGVTVVVIAATSWACLACAAFLRQMEEAVSNAGAVENAIVLSKAAHSELDSSVAKETADQLEALPGIERSGGRAMSSREFVGDLTLGKTETSAGYPILLRGVEPIAMQVHPGLKLLQGRAPNPGASELMVGRQAARLLSLAVGQSIPVVERPWEVTGIFEAGGSNLEREVWGSRDAVTHAFKHDGQISSLVVGLEAPSALTTLKQALERRPDFAELSVQGEREFRSQESVALRITLTSVSWIIIAVAAGAIFAATSALQASALRRRQELSTLIALGFRRGRIGRMVLVESVLLATAASVTGALLLGPLAKLIDLPRRLASTADVDFSLSPFAVAFAIGLGLVIGLLSGAYPAWWARRVSLIDGLR